mmetsp:Transcript_65822/g.109385  ORF Transcript_65822/g.109385 Transcript_65822/m.109385 type:complete len:83 (+) Transcript_65822:253-501(+)
MQRTCGWQQRQHTQAAEADDQCDYGSGDDVDSIGTFHGPHVESVEKFVAFASCACACKHIGLHLVLCVYHLGRNQVGTPTNF